ncbi:MAG: family 1 glycosylhydrolase [Candidatus Sericytochromatia bacterium]|nr:family 1 glycosylhydrolase [Candidatus Sericytochromatia bacterium]
MTRWFSSRGVGRALAGLSVCLSLLACGRAGLLPAASSAGSQRLAVRQVSDPAAPFPGDFLWGVATSGHQSEGGDQTSNWAAWGRAGKVAQPIGPAIDFWNRYEEDLDLAAGLGLKAFRFSLEWARIEPEPGVFDPQAVQHYHDLLTAVRARGMTPIVTLVHFSYPAWLDQADPQGRRGWESDRMPEQFARFAGWAAQEYGSAVDWWLTINEPNTYALVGYMAGMMPPGKVNPWAYAAVMANISKAHKAGYEAIHAHDTVARVSINPIVIHARNADPDYPGEREEKLDGPLNKGFYVDVLSFFDQFAPRRTGTSGTPAAPQAKRHLDFMAFNYFYAVKAHELPLIGNYERWPLYPEGLYEVAKKLHGRYQLPLMVTENGMPTPSDNPRPDGWTREAYIVNHLLHLRRAMAEGVPVLGYMHWTLVDNYEWGSYEPKFGLFGVDRRDPQLRRFPTASAAVYEAIVKQNRIPPYLLERYQGRRR